MGILLAAVTEPSFLDDFQLALTGAGLNPVWWWTAQNPGEAGYLPLFHRLFAEEGVPAPVHVVWAPQCSAEQWKELRELCEATAPADGRSRALLHYLDINGVSV